MYVLTDPNGRIVTDSAGRVRLGMPGDDCCCGEPSTCCTRRVYCECGTGICRACPGMRRFVFRVVWEDSWLRNAYNGAGCFEFCETATDIYRRDTAQRITCDSPPEWLEGSTITRSGTYTNFGGPVCPAPTPSSGGGGSTVILIGDGPGVCTNFGEPGYHTCPNPQPMFTVPANLANGNNPCQNYEDSLDFDWCGTGDGNVTERLTMTRSCAGYSWSWSRVVTVGGDRITDEKRSNGSVTYEIEEGCEPEGPDPCAGNGPCGSGPPDEGRMREPLIARLIAESVGTERAMWLGVAARAGAGVFL